MKQRAGSWGTAIQWTELQEEGRRTEKEDTIANPE